MSVLLTSFAMAASTMGMSANRGERCASNKKVKILTMLVVLVLHHECN
jgi:hypothetical protein